MNDIVRHFKKERFRRSENKLSLASDSEYNAFTGPNMAQRTSTDRKKPYMWVGNKKSVQPLTAHFE